MSGAAKLANREELHLEIIFNAGTKASDSVVQNMRITNLYLSASPIPEPSGTVMTAAGINLLAFRRRK